MMIQNERIRMQATVDNLMRRVSLLEVERSRAKRLQRTRGLLFLPTSIYFKRLRNFQLKGQQAPLINHVAAGLGQLAVVDDSAIRSTFLQVLSFARATGSLGGLESLFLTCMHNLRITGERTLYRVGANCWRQVQPEARTITDRTLIIFYDRETSMVTFVPGGLMRNAGPLSENGFFDDPIGSAVRYSFGYAVDGSDFWGPLNRPGGAIAGGDSFSKCAEKVVAICTAAGFIGGEGAGAVPGGIIGGLIAGWFCDDVDASAPLVDPGVTPADENPDAGVPPESNPIQSADGGSSQPDQSIDPGSSQPNQSIDPGSSQPNQSTDTGSSEGPIQSIDPGNQSGGYPTPDGPGYGGPAGMPTPDGGPSGPLSFGDGAFFYPNPDSGGVGGPKGLTGFIESASVPTRAMPISSLGLRAGNSMTFLVHSMPRLAAGNRSLQRVGFANLFSAGNGGHLAGS